MAAILILKSFKSLMLLMTTYLLSGTINLSNMLLLRVRGYKSNHYENIDFKISFQSVKLDK